MKLLRARVVDLGSMQTCARNIADPRLQPEVEKDHREMVKVEAREDPLYKNLIEQLLKASEATPSTQSRSKFP